MTDTPGSRLPLDTADLVRRTQDVLHRCLQQRRQQQMLLEAIRINLDALREAREAGSRRLGTLRALGLQMKASVGPFGDGTPRNGALMIDLSGFHLTPREVQVAYLLAEGRSNAGVAEMLGISEHTARHHTESVLAKLGVRSRAEAGALVRGWRPAPETNGH
jgi:DNA-binding CsgD family transcriptional regulator